jgi:hypothetical protein
MPQALNLAEAYNTLSIEQLKEEEEFEEFYVDRPTSSPIEALKDEIELSKRVEKYLFLGFRGCGKSTELNRLTRMMDGSRFIVINYSVRDELDLTDFDFRDFFASMALKIYDVAENVIPLNPDIKADFEEFTMELMHVSEEEVSRTKALGLSFSKIVVGKLGTEAKSREYVRKELEVKIAELIRRLNVLIAEVERKTAKRIVVVIDDLDKLIRYAQAEVFFYKNYPLLLQPNCFVIYTFPIPLAFNPFFESVRHAFDDVVILPQPPVKTRDGERINKEIFDYYRKIAGRRMDLNLIDNNALEHAIVSTGKLSEFISVLKDASIRAYRNRKGAKKEKIIKEEVENALEKLRNAYDRTLNEEHIKRLIEIHDKKRARDRSMEDSIGRDLLFSLTAVEYKSEEGRWCDVNPILLPLVETWKKE